MYYTYIITNPLVEQKVHLPELNLELTHQPIYIGKASSKKRCLYHLNKASERENPEKWKFIEPLLLDYQMGDYIIIIPRKTEEAAFILEETLIKKFGRKKDKGILFNKRRGRQDPPALNTGGELRREKQRIKVKPEDYILVINKKTNLVEGEFCTVFDICEAYHFAHGAGYTITKRLKQNKSYKHYYFIRKKDYIQPKSKFELFCETYNWMDLIVKIWKTSKGDFQLFKEFTKNFGSKMSPEKFDLAAYKFCYNFFSYH